nr:VOC family protein [uncultured Dongia sp.]
MMKINPYLTFNGDCKQAMEFYAKCLRTQVAMMMSYADTPMAADTPAGIRGRIAHARIVLGDQVLMASDAYTDEHVETKGMTVSLVVDAPAEADRLFEALSAGGKVTMPIAETFWAQRFGMLQDKFGIPWMVNCEKPM